ncbi:MAG TPA: universal stress protein [Cyclobacteriaceae bacterium]|nr:universal stress protein [Cyclobacteriaceae bacterium]
MKKILVPCDFSKPAINAFRFALDIAAKSNGSVHLLNVVELPVLHDTVLMPVLSFEEQLLNELREKGENEFSKIITKYAVEGVKVTSEVAFGITTKSILDHISENDIDIIVMGSHGASGFRELIIGSNAEKIVRSATVPVLVIKEYRKDPIKSIVFPNTLETEHQEELVMKVKALQHFFDAKLNIVWINTPLNFTSDVVSHERLTAFAKRYMLKDYTINIFNHPNEEEGIIKFTQMIKGDLIAMGTHGRRGVSHLMLGSLAEDVVNHSQSIIWTYSLKNEAVEA